MTHPEALPGEIEQQISEGVVRLYLDTFGKGPLHAETFVNGDVVTTLLRDAFTVAEKWMVEEGKIDSVLNTRMHWRHVTDARFRVEVEKAMGRTVISVISGFDPVRGFASEVFVLQPD